jgi:hypothetical protein
VKNADEKKAVVCGPGLKRISNLLPDAFLKTQTLTCNVEPVTISEFFLESCIPDL